MSDQAERPRRKRRVSIRARVLECYLATAATSRADVWNHRRLVVVQLTCGHQIRRFSKRRFLTGELMTCPKCTAKGPPDQLRMWPDLELQP